MRGVNLRLDWGDRVAVFGPNGAGKTTLLRTLAGLVRPAAGELRIAGAAPHDQPAARRLIGVVAHQTYLHDDLSVAENLDFYGRLYGVADRARRAGELLERVGLEDRRHDRVGALSRGMQQRLAIARALLHDPPILLLDEPDTGLDLEAFARLGPLLLGPAARPRTLLVASHNLELGLALTERLAVLASGRLVAERSTAGLGLDQLRGLYAELAFGREAATAGAAAETLRDSSLRGGR